MQPSAHAQIALSLCLGGADFPACAPCRKRATPSRPYMQSRRNRSALNVASVVKPARACGAIRSCETVDRHGMSRPKPLLKRGSHVGPAFQAAAGLLPGVLNEDGHLTLLRWDAVFERIQAPTSPRTFRSTRTSTRRAEARRQPERLAPQNPARAGRPTPLRHARHSS